METFYNLRLSKRDRSNVQDKSASGHFSATNQTETDLVPVKMPVTERTTNKAKGNKIMDMLSKAREGRQLAINGRNRGLPKAVPSAHLGNVTFISRRAQSARAF